MSDDRAAFEAEMKAAGYAYSTDRRAMLYADGETYRSLAWQAGWEMWRAGMRAGIERAAGVCEQVGSVHGLRAPSPASRGERYYVDDGYGCAAAIRALVKP